MNPKYDYRQFSRIRRVGSVAFNPQDTSKVYYQSNTRGRQDIWMQTLPQSNPKQLTFANDWYLGGFGLTDDGESIIFVANYQGNEKLQIFELPATGGIPRRITKDLDKRYFPAQGGDLGNGKMLISTDSFGTTMDAGILDRETGEIEMITATDTNYFVNSVSPDKKFAIIGEQLNNTHNILYLLDLDTREMEKITPEGAVALFGPAAWKADSSGFYFTTDYQREFRAGGYFSLTERKWDLLFAPEWNVGQILASRDGKWLSYLTNERGYTRLHLTNLQTGEKIDPSNFPTNGLIFANEFSRDGKYLSYGYEDSSKVTDIHIMNLETMEESIITDNMLGGIDPQDMVHPELARLTSYEEDKLEFDVFVYRPKN
ncbi:MAG: TolB family protein, partial [Candidatus Kariarchaeaceae archaeon]